MIKSGGSVSQNFQQLPFFSGLPENDIDVLMKAANIRTYNKNEHIHHQGDDAERFYVVLKGWIRLYRQTIDGYESVASLLTTGDIFGETALTYRSKNYIFSAQAVEESTVYVIRKAVLEERIEKNPEILRHILASVSQKMNWVQTENEHMFHMKTSQRVACLLLRLSAHMIGNGGTFTLPYDKSIAASQLGMKRETFSRALTQLKPMGVSVNGSEVTIDSFKRLNNFCCAHCSLSAGECPGARSQSYLYQNVWQTSPINQPRHSSHYS